MKNVINIIRKKTQKFITSYVYYNLQQLRKKLEQQKNRSLNVLFPFPLDFS